MVELSFRILTSWQARPRLFDPLWESFMMSPASRRSSEFITTAETRNILKLDETTLSLDLA